MSLIKWEVERSWLNLIYRRLDFKFLHNSDVYDMFSSSVFLNEHLFSFN